MILFVIVIMYLFRDFLGFPLLTFKALYNFVRVCLSQLLILLEFSNFICKKTRMILRYQVCQITSIFRQFISFFQKSYLEFLEKCDLQYCPENLPYTHFFFFFLILGRLLSQIAILGSAARILFKIKKYRFPFIPANNNLDVYNHLNLGSGTN